MKYNKAIRAVMKRWVQWAQRKAIPDSLSEAVDRLVNEIKQSPKTQKYHDVLRAEYQTAGRQKAKAALLAMSHNYYRHLLCRAHALIAMGLKSLGVMPAIQ